MARRILREIQTGLGVGTTAGVGDPVKSVRSEQGIDDETYQQFSAEVVQAAHCQSCRRAMFEAVHVGGICVGCGSVVCAECAKMRCAICNACCCDARSCSDTIAGSKVCLTHGFGAYIRLALAGRL